MTAHFTSVLKKRDGEILHPSFGNHLTSTTFGKTSTPNVWYTGLAGLAALGIGAVGIVRTAAVSAAAGEHGQRHGGGQGKTEYLFNSNSTYCGAAHGRQCFLWLSPYSPQSTGPLSHDTPTTTYAYVK